MILLSSLGPRLLHDVVLALGIKYELEVRIGSLHALRHLFDLQRCLLEPLLLLAEERLPCHALGLSLLSHGSQPLAQFLYEHLLLRHLLLQVFDLCVLDLSQLQLRLG